MKAFCRMFKERCDQYIDQSDALYAYLIEPYLNLKDSEEEDVNDDNPPKPAFYNEMKQPKPIVLPKYLFCL